jgi:hypothetical protein
VRGGGFQQIKVANQGEIFKIDPFKGRRKVIIVCKKL